MKKDFITKNIGYAAAALVALLWLCTSFITMGKTGKSLSQIISESSMTFIAGVCIDYVLGIQGALNGERDQRMLNTRALHNSMVERISPYIEYLDEWCEQKNEAALKSERTKLLAAAGLKYDEIFDEKAVATPYVPSHENLKSKEKRYAEKQRIKAYKKAVRLRITLLSSGELTGEGGRAGDPNYLGPTKPQFGKNTMLKDIGSKIAIALIFGYYAAELIENFDVASLIWRALQAAVFVVTGIIRMHSFFTFTVDEYRNRIIKKIDHLQKYENDIKNGRLGSVSNTKAL